jgi:hypothetical protein
VYLAGLTKMNQIYATLFYERTAGSRNTPGRVDALVHAVSAAHLMYRTARALRASTRALHSEYLLRLRIERAQERAATLSRVQLVRVAPIPNCEAY